jgi:hypothetical protein
MSRFNMGRWFLGGIVAGVVLDILGYLVDGILLAPRWTEGMKALGHGGFSSGQIVWFNVIGIVLGLVTVWIYAAIRPRFGPGAITAAYAGLAVWIAGALLPNASMMCVTGLFSRHLTLYTTLGALVEIVAGSIAGAALYTEGEQPAA